MARALRRKGKEPTGGVQVGTEAEYMTVTGASAAPSTVAGLVSKVLVGHCYLQSTFPGGSGYPKEGYF